MKKSYVVLVACFFCFCSFLKAQLIDSPYIFSASSDYHSYAWHITEGRQGGSGGAGSTSHEDVYITPRSFFPVVAPVNFQCAGVTAINITNSYCDGARQYHRLKATPSAGMSGWNWTVDYGNVTIVSGGNTPTPQVSVVGGGVVRLSYKDVCGNIKQDGITIWSSCSGGYYAYAVAPNIPPSDLTISVAGN